MSIDQPWEYFHQRPGHSMTPEHLLDALQDDIEWPDATLRFQLHYLTPPWEICAGVKVLLGKVVELRRRLEWAGQALNDILD
jgi:hypothetical protein